MHPFDICIEQPLLWKYIKIAFIFSYIFSSFIISNSIFLLFIKPFDKPKKLKKSSIQTTHFSHNQLSLFIGKNVYTNEKIYLPEKALYQNILVTGTIGTGKTSIAMYPFMLKVIIVIR